MRGVKGIIVFLLCYLLFVASFSIIYPLYAPPYGYFMIEKIKPTFWLIYSFALLIYSLCIFCKGISRHIKLIIIYLLLLLALMRIYASLHFTGLWGGDSPRYLGLTEYYVSHDRVDFSKVIYGENPGLFILGKISILICAFSDIGLYTNIMGILWIILMHAYFRILLKMYMKEQCGSTKLLFIFDLNSSAFFLTYFSLASLFYVNFQYTPQTFALVLLIVYYSLILDYKYVRNSWNLIPITLIYIALQVSHPFFFMFVVLPLFLLLVIFSIVKRVQRTDRTSNIMNKYYRFIRYSSLISFVISLSYILYQTTILKKDVATILENFFSLQLGVGLPIRPLRSLATPSYPQYHETYLIIAYAHSLGWIFLFLLLILLIFKGLKTIQELDMSIMLGAIIMGLIFSLGGGNVIDFSVRVGQIILYVLLLIAMKGFVRLVNSNYKRAKRMIVSILAITIVLAFLGTVRYTWYSQLPHLTPQDFFVANMLGKEEYLGHNIKLSFISSYAFDIYYEAKIYGFYSDTSISPAYMDDIGTIYKMKTGVLWTNELYIDILKYFNVYMRLETLQLRENIIFNAGSMTMFFP